MREFIELLIKLGEIAITLYFSIGLYRLNKKGQELSEKIANKDIEKDEKGTAKIAIEVSQVLKYNFFTILQNYNVINKNKKSSFSEFILVEDWINKIGTFIDILSTKEINNLYKFYLELEKISKNTMDKSKDLLENMVDEIFQKQFLEYSIYIEEVDYRLFLEKKYFDILKKLEGKYTKINKSNSEYNDLRQELEMPKDFSHIGTEYTDNIYFKDELIMYGIKIDNFNINTSVYLNENGEKSGYYTELDKNSKIQYSGNIMSDKKHGAGKEYKNGKLKFDGIFNKEEYLKGKYTSNIYPIIYFEGEYKKGVPYTGKIEIKGFYKQIDSWIKDFKGEIKEGKYFNGNGKKCVEIQPGRKSDQRDIEELEIQKIKENNVVFNESYYNTYYDDDIPDDVKQEIFEEQEKAILENEFDYLQVYKKQEYNKGNIKLTEEKSYDGIYLENEYL